MHLLGNENRFGGLSKKFFIISCYLVRQRNIQKQTKKHTHRHICHPFWIVKENTGGAISPLCSYIPLYKSALFIFVVVDFKSGYKKEEWVVCGLYCEREGKRESERFILSVSQGTLL